MTISKENWHLKLGNLSFQPLGLLAFWSVHKRSEISIVENGQRSTETIEASHSVVYLGNFLEDPSVNHSTAMFEYFLLKIITLLLLLTRMLDTVRATYLPVWSKSFMQHPQYAREIENYAISLSEFISDSNPKWPLIVAFLNSSCAVWTENIWCVFRVKPSFSNSSGGVTTGDTFLES